MRGQAQDPSFDSYRYLEAHLIRLRLLLHRRILWLRRQWNDDPLEAYHGFVVTEPQVDALLLARGWEERATFYDTDPEALRIGQRLSENAAELARLTTAQHEDATRPSLAAVSNIFGLTSFEQAVLVLAVAPEVDPSFEQLYAYAHDDATRRYATVHLALALLVEEPRDWAVARAAFTKDAPLLRYQLVRMETLAGSASFASRALRVDARIAEYLVGIDSAEERIGALLTPVPSLPMVPAHAAIAAGLARDIETSRTAGRDVLVSLVGPPGCGKRALARRVCDQLGLGLATVDVPRMISAPDFGDLLKVLGREAALTGTVVYLELPDGADSTSVGDLVERLDAPMIVASRQRWATRRRALTVHLGRTTAVDRVSLWNEALGERAPALEATVRTVAQQFEFGPDDVTALASAPALDLWRSCREHANISLEPLAQRIVPCHRWDDLVLPEDLRQQLKELADQVGGRATVYGDWNFETRLSRGRGITALFAGPSGTGKTMAAEVIADQLQLDLFRIDLAGVVDKYIGETEKKLRTLFDTAEESGAILFFDEADALIGKRSDVRDSHDRYANIEVSYLLQRMDDYRGLAILATNRKSAIDRAFLRRLRFLVDFPFPDAASRRRIWQGVFPRETPLEDLDLDELSRLEITGGNIRNIALNAAFLAAAAGSAVSMTHCLDAARREYAKIDRLVSEGEFGDRVRRIPA